MPQPQPGSPSTGAALHLPLAGDDARPVAEIEAWLAAAAGELDLSVSHLSPALRSPRCRPPTRIAGCALRVGTALWHGDKSFLHLGADVLDVQPLDGAAPRRLPRARRRAGATRHGTLVARSAPAPPTGSRRSMTVAARSTSPAVAWRCSSRRTCTRRCARRRRQPVPGVGDIVDVQRPLITTQADDWRWM